MKHKEMLLKALNEYDSLGIAGQIDYQKFCLYSLITHSTAIEGSTVTEIENRLLFDEGISAKGRTIQEQMMNLDLKAAYEKSMRLAHLHTDFSIGMLKDLSSLVMKNTGSIYNTAQGSFDASKGDLRLLGVSAGIGGRSYMNYQKVPGKLAEFCEQLNRDRHQLMGTEDIIAKYLLSFDAHYHLVTIHPWADGNGRMSRLVMNHLQYEFGLVPVKIIKEDKAAYIQALVDSREQDSPEPFRTFMLEEHIRNISSEIADYKRSQEMAPTNRLENDTVNDTVKSAASNLSMTEQKVLSAISSFPSYSYEKLAACCSLSRPTVARIIKSLRNQGFIRRVGSDKTGHWEVIGK
ncbi:MAG: Fic family protein [Bacteroidales bacterium]|nr:Fic family protein [Bacteroidales bacterium]